MADSKEILKRFLFPKLTKRFFIRLTIIVASAYVVFGHICVPMRIAGLSMEPTYQNGGFAFYWRLKYLFSKPERGDVVTVSLAGRSIMYLKRIVAFEGEIVEFRDGKLFVNDEELNEPYIKKSCDWNQSPVKVEEGYLYVVGDNRSVPFGMHQCGQVEERRIKGGM